MTDWSPAAWLGRASVWCAAAGLLLNDHYLKGRAPGVLTGKLSDILGMFLVPLVWMVCVGACIRLTGVRVAPRMARRILSVLCMLAAACLVVVKTTEVGAATFGHIIGILRAALRSPLAFMYGSSLPPVRPIEVVVDPTDLIALIALLPAIWVGRRILFDEPAVPPANVRQEVVVDKAHPGGVALDRRTTDQRGRWGRAARRDLRH